MTESLQERVAGVRALAEREAWWEVTNALRFGPPLVVAWVAVEVFQELEGIKKAQFAAALHDAMRLPAQDGRVFQLDDSITSAIEQLNICADELGARYLFMYRHSTHDGDGFWLDKCWRPKDGRAQWGLFYEPAPQPGGTSIPLREAPLGVRVAFVGIAQEFFRNYVVQAKAFLGTVEEVLRSDVVTSVRKEVAGAVEAYDEAMGKKQ